MRRLATIRMIDEIKSIDGADKICAYRIDGWWIVDFIDLFKVGDLCVYMEVDSFIPITPAVEHLRAKAFKRMGEKEGIRIKTIKLRGQLSQGLALPLSKFSEVPVQMEGYTEYKFGDNVWNIGEDVSDHLGVVLYELPIPTQLAGQVRGNFPNFIKKTDQERCQNLGRDIFETNKDSKYEVTMKLDGSSFTAYFNNGTDGVCSRNMDLELGEWNVGNSLVRMYIDSGLQAALAVLGRNIAVQGELLGVGIQGNKEGFIFHKLAIFDVYDIDAQCHKAPKIRFEIINDLFNLGLNKEMVIQVPVLYLDVNLSDLNICNMSGLLEFAKGPSIHAPLREGVVFKRMDGQFSFKVINNDWLLKNE